MKYRKLDTLQGILGMLRPAVVAMIAAAGVSIITTSFFGEMEIALSSIKMNAVVIFMLCMFLLLKWKKNPVFVMVLAGVLNIGIALITGGV